MSNSGTSRYFRIIMTSIRLLALALLCIGLFVSTTSASQITISSFNDAAGLGLRDVLRAANFGGGNVDIDGTTFTGFPLTPTGDLIDGQSRIVDGLKLECIDVPCVVRAPLGNTAPNFDGDVGTLTPAEDLARGFALSNGGGTGFEPTRMQLTFANLNPGAAYIVKLIFFEGFGAPIGRRFFDVLFNGNLAADEFDINFVAGGTPSAGALLTHTFIAAADGREVIVLDPEGFVENFSPMISAAALMAVPEPSTMLLLGFGLVGLGFFGRRRIAA